MTNWVTWTRKFACVINQLKFRSTFKSTSRVPLPFSMDSRLLSPLVVSSVTSQPHLAHDRVRHHRSASSNSSTSKMSRPRSRKMLSTKTLKRVAKRSKLPQLPLPLNQPITTQLKTNPKNPLPHDLTLFPKTLALLREMLLFFKLLFLHGQSPLLLGTAREPQLLTVPIIKFHMRTALRN